MLAATRIPCDNYDITLRGGAASIHQFVVSVARDAAGRIVEVVFSGRGKTGHGIDLMFADLGVKLSRIIQGRDPEAVGDDDD